MISARGLVAAQYFSAGASCQCSARGSTSGERAERFFGQSPIHVDQQHLMILIELVPGPRLSHGELTFGNSTVTTRTLLDGLQAARYRL